MKSYPQVDQVLEDLGEKVVTGFALMVAQTREDLRVYRTTFPGWVSDSSDRGLLNWCRDRLWAHAVRVFDRVEGVDLNDRPPIREISVGARYRLRVKKHDVEGRVSTYPTQGALEFMEQEQLVLDGLDEVRLIAGYRWDADSRDLGAAVISLRDGMEKVVWIHDLDEPATGSVSTVVPILPPSEPRPPQIEIQSDERGEGAQGG
jgi:hypothetical protein